MVNDGVIVHQVPIERPAEFSRASVEANAIVHAGIVDDIVYASIELADRLDSRPGFFV